MVNRRWLLRTAIVVIGTAASSAVSAFDAKGFNLKEFEGAQSAGKSILVEVTAPWCPSCKAQAPILGELLAKPKFKDLVVFKIDFDSQKDLLRKFDVFMQSTLISYKGAKEVERSTGSTNAAAIEAQLDKSL